MGLDNKKAYLLLGSNLGNREQLMNEAIEKIEKEIGTISSRSAFYETAAWGKEDQPGFLNIALEVNTLMEPLALLEKALEIENELGRIREEKWGARLIDIDIILFDALIVDVPEKLQIPHPQMQYRKFVLEPLAEIAADYVHPILGKTVLELLRSLSDNLLVSKINF